MSDAIARLWRRIQQTVGRARVATVDDSGPTQKMQITGGAPGEVIDGIRRLAEYGFTSVPPAGSDVIAAFIAGERSNGVVIATSNQTYRLKNLGNGDVALYDDRGRYIRLGAGGISVDAGAGAVQVSNATQVLVFGSVKIGLTAPEIDFDGAVKVTGTLEVTGAATFDAAILSGGHDIGGTHVHTGGTILGKTGPVTP